MKAFAEQWPDAMAQLDPIGRHTIYFNVMIRCSGIFLFCSLQTITRYFARKELHFYSMISNRRYDLRLNLTLKLETS